MAEVGGLKDNLSMVRERQLPSMVISNLLDNKYNSDKAAWKFMSNYAHMPISINMMQKYLSSLKKQLTNEKLSPSQVLEWHIPKRTQTPDVSLGPECIPSFRTANVDACGQFKRFVRQWLSPEHIEIEQPHSLF